MNSKIYFIFIFLLLAITLPKKSSGQIFEEFGTDKEEKSDEKKEKKKVDPLIKSWQLSEYGAFTDSTALDTTLDDFHNYHPVFKNTLTTTYVGNYGTPSLDNNFFTRKSNVDYFFFRTREAYLLTPATVEYYNTHTPYTRLDFSQNQNRIIKNETRFNVFHSQNVNPWLNFTMRVNLAKSAGQYNAQESKNGFIALYSSYTTDKLDIYGGVITDNVKNNENGGLTNDNLIFNGAETELLSTNLNASKSEFKSTYYYAKGEYRIGKIIETEADSSIFRPILGILMSTQYERHLHKFVDEEEAGNSFFENTYYGPGYLTDSMRFNRLNNVFQLKQYENTQRKVSFGTRAFLGFDIVSTTSPGSDTITISNVGNNYTNLYAGGGIFRETGKFWNWKFDGTIYFIGPKAGQTELGGLIMKPFKVAKDSAAALIISGNINNKVADYFQHEYYSNHYRWNNNFKMEQRMDATGTIVAPRYKLQLSGNYALINNFIYNNEQGIPDQTEKELLIFSAFADKDFNYKNMHFRTRLLWQQTSSDEFLHLPVFTTFISAYYKFVMAKVLFAQIGADTRYNTKYYADAYSPATGLFYLQDEKKYGNFPYIDIYANLRLKRTIAFFKMSNIGTNFLDGEYITTPNYPMPRSVFRFGVSWIFYD